MSRRSARGLFAICLLLLTSSLGCWEQWSVEWFPQMKWQNAVQPFERVAFQGRDAAFLPPEGAVPIHGYEPPVGEVYAANETANGELGFYLVSHGGNRPHRVRCRPPSFINYQCFPHLVVGHRISDVVAVLSGMNIIAAELDR